MKTINAYTNYCTQEQTNRAIKLGCPCESPEDYSPIKLPTTQQMIGWLRDKGLDVFVARRVMSGLPGCGGMFFAACFVLHTMNDLTDDTTYCTVIEAELAAIDAALDYIEKLDAPSRKA